MIQLIDHIAITVRNLQETIDFYAKLGFKPTTRNETPTQRAPGPRLQEVFEAYGEYIASETLSKVLRNSTSPEGAFVNEYLLNGERLKIGLIALKNQ